MPSADGVSSLATLPHPLTGKPVCPWCRRESPPPEHTCHDALADAMTRIAVLEDALRAKLAEEKQGA